MQHRRLMQKYCAFTADMAGLIHIANFLSRFNQGSFRDPVIKQVFKNLGRAFHRGKILCLKIGRPCFHAVTILHCTQHPVGKQAPIFCATAWAGFDLPPGVR